MATIQRSTGSTRGGRRRMMNEINVVPYIDVMLVLLVIFMVSTPMMTTGVVDLPSVAKTNQASIPPIEILIAADGALSVREKTSGTKKMTNAELIAYVQQTQTNTASANATTDGSVRPVVIAADKNVKYETVMNLMSELQRNNVQRVGLMVRNSGK